MNVVIRFAIAAIALGMFFVPAQPTAAKCYGSACGAVLVPAPNPIPLRKLKVVPAPAPLPAPCGPGCVNAMNAWAGPPPCGQGGCGGPRAMVYVPKQTYAFWKQPGYTACYPGFGNCYWRRDCWYDSFGRRFCN
ncbi:MAG: hypothetical protein R6X03_04575 [Methyloceanibacter sp.]